MKPLTLRPCLAFLALALVLVALAPGRAHGDMVNFAYTWGLGESYLSAFGQGPITLSSSRSPDGSGITVDHGNGTVALALAAPGSSGVTPGDAPVTITVGSLTATLNDRPAGDFSYTAGMNLTLRITDQASGESGDLTLSASLFGNVSPKGTEAGAAGWTTLGAQGIKLGEHVYTAGFSVDPFDPLVIGADPVLFNVGLFVDPTGFPVEMVDGGVTTQDNPEPSAFVLAACAVAACGMRALRRRFNRG